MKNSTKSLVIFCIYASLGITLNSLTETYLNVINTNPLIFTGYLILLYFFGYFTTPLVIDYLFDNKDSFYNDMKRHSLNKET